MTEILAASLRFMLVALVAYKVVRWGYMLNQIERFGLGIMGGSAFLTIPVILDSHSEGTPFDTWAGVLLSFGIILYLGGRISRHVRHEHNNELAKEQSLQHFRSKA